MTDLDRVLARSGSCDGVRPLLGDADATERTTPWRWWILIVYSLLSMCQAGTWNVFGPIWDQTFKAFPSWTDSYLTWVINSANITFGLTLYPASQAIKRFGPRRVTLYSACTIFLGAALRCLPVPDGPAQRTLMVFSMLLNGTGGMGRDVNPSFSTQAFFTRLSACQAPGSTLAGRS